MWVLKFIILMTGASINAPDLAYDLSYHEAVFRTEEACNAVTSRTEPYEVVILEPCKFDPNAKESPK